MEMNAKRFVLWGSAGHAKVLADLIRLRRGRVEALFDNNPGARSCLPGVPIYHGREGFISWLEQHSNDAEIFAVIAIGTIDKDSRLIIASYMQKYGLKMISLIHPTASVSHTSSIGFGCQVLANSVVAADVAIGNLCILNNSCNVDHECIIGDNVHVAPGAVLCGCINIGKNVMIGAGAVILPRISIGNDSIIGAGSVVTNDVKSNEIVAGNPAKIIRTKND